MNTVTTMNTAVKTVRETTTAPTFFASPVAANEDYSDVRMTLTDLIEFVGLEERRDSIIRRMETLAENGVIRFPQIVKFEKINNLDTKKPLRRVAKRIKNLLLLRSDHHRSEHRI